MERNTYYVSASGDNKYHEVIAKNLTAAKGKAAKIYQKSTGGRISIYTIGVYANGEKDYREIAYWSGHDWEWHNAV